MAEKYWFPASGTGSSTGNWDSTTNWSSSSASYVSTTAPTSADNANFGSYSGATAFTVTVGALGGNCLAMIVNNANMTLAGAATNTLTVYGAITWTACANPTFTGTIDCNASATNTLNFGGKTLPAMTLKFSGAGTKQLGANLLGSAALVPFAGTFATSTFNITAASLVSTTTCTVNLGSGTHTFSGASGWQVVSGVTVTAGTSTLVFSGNGQTLNLGATKTYNIVQLPNTNATQTYFIGSSGGAVNIGTLTVTPRTTAGTSVIYMNGSLNVTTFSHAASGTFPGSARTLITSNSVPTVYFLTCGAASTFNDIDFSFVSGSFNGANITGTRLGALGSNTGITATAAKTVYWNLAGSNNWNATGWATTSTGTPATTNYPLPQDTAIISNQNPAASSTITLPTNTVMPNTDFSTRTNALTLTSAGSGFWGGSLALSTAMTVTGSTSQQFRPPASLTGLTTAGRTLPFSTLIVNSGSQGSIKLNDALTLSGSLSLVSGFLTLGYQLTCLSITANGSSGNSFQPGASNVYFTGSGTVWSLAGGPTALIAGTSTFYFSSSLSKTFSGNGGTYNNIVQSGAGQLTITGANTFASIQETVAATTTIVFPASATQTFTGTGLVINSGDTNVVTLQSSSAGIAATLSKASGTVTVNYASIKDIAVTGGATWSPVNSTNVSGNSGWTWPGTGGSVNSNFFAFFG